MRSTNSLCTQERCFSRAVTQWPCSAYALGLQGSQCVLAQVTSYDNSSYASYGQASSFKDYQQQQAPQQPAAPVQPKYSAPNVALPPPPQQQQQASAAAGPHAAYNSGYGHSATAYGSTASPAPSTSAPPSGASNQVRCYSMQSFALFSLS